MTTPATESVFPGTSASPGTLMLVVVITILPF
jgi:hypothetical protein